MSGLRRTAAGVPVVVLAAGAAIAPAARHPVIPWLDRHPVKASAHPQLAPACRAPDLRARLFLQGATGSLVGGVTLTNAGGRACSLLGRPAVSFTGAGAATTHWQVRKLGRRPEPADVLADPPGSLRALAPGKSASVELFWSNWCGAPPHGIRLRLAGGTSLVVPVAHAPRCDSDQAPSTLSVAPYTPTVRHLPPSSRLPLAARIVGRQPVLVKPGLHAFRVHRGQLLRYRVAVTNTSREVFRFASSSCPTYIQQLLPGAAEPQILNCRAAAAIPPHATVLFAMQVHIPRSLHLGNNSLTWELAPKTYEAPFAAAAVWVVP